MSRALFVLSVLVSAFAFVAVYGEPQHYYFSPNSYLSHYVYPAPIYANQPSDSSSQLPADYFRAAAPYQQEIPSTLGDPRIFFSLLSGGNLFTLTYSTTTTTKTSVITAYCTTSTAALSTCTAGRRRRGIFYDEDPIRERRGLFHNDEDKIEGASSISSLDQSDLSAVESSNQGILSDDVTTPIRSSMSGHRSKRQFVAFAVATSTVTTTTTSTSSLTAICSSTTGYPLCASG